MSFSTIYNTQLLVPHTLPPVLPLLFSKVRTHAHTVTLEE